MHTHMCCVVQHSLLCKAASIVVCFCVTFCRREKPRITCVALSQCVTQWNPMVRKTCFFVWAKYLLLILNVQSACAAPMAQLRWNVFMVTYRWLGDPRLVAWFVSFICDHRSYDHPNDGSSVDQQNKSDCWAARKLHRLWFIIKRMCRCPDIRLMFIVSVAPFNGPFPNTVRTFHVDMNEGNATINHCPRELNARNKTYRSFTKRILGIVDGYWRCHKKWHSWCVYSTTQRRLYLYNIVLVLKWTIGASNSWLS